MDKEKQRYTRVYELGDGPSQPCDPECTGEFVCATDEDLNTAQGNPVPNVAGCYLSLGADCLPEARVFQATAIQQALLVNVIYIPIGHAMSAMESTVSLTKPMNTLANRLSLALVALMASSIWMLASHSLIK